MENTPFDQLMQHIIHTLEKNGYNPVFQLEGYLKTGDPTYITRSDDARKLIQQLDITRVEQYIKTHFHKAT